jgi:hypothetical protein
VGTSAASTAAQAVSGMLGGPQVLGGAAQEQINGGPPAVAGFDTSSSSSN